MNAFDSFIFDLLSYSNAEGVSVSDTLVAATRLITHLGDGLVLAAISSVILIILLYFKYKKAGFFWTVRPRPSPTG